MLENANVLARYATICQQVCTIYLYFTRTLYVFYPAHTVYGFYPACVRKSLALKTLVIVAD